MLANVHDCLQCVQGLDVFDAKAVWILDFHSDVILQLNERQRIETVQDNEDGFQVDVRL